jgi:pyruvate dehydrogenase E2 component (dihydrolipoamide acetyltransferase)
MPIEITMPQLSDTMTEGTVVKWRKKEGEKVSSGETIAEIETDKATMEQESFDSGTMAAIVVAEGQKVKVGEVIAVLAGAGEKVEDIKKQYAGGAKAPAKKQAAASGVPEAVATIGTEGDRSERAGDHAAVGSSSSRSTGTAVAPPAAPDDNGETRVRISPLARRMAAERGVDLAQIRGSGPGGRIVQKDVEAALSGAASQGRTPVMASIPAPAPGAPAAGKPASLAPRVASGQKDVVPLTKMRATIAQRLQQAKQQIPHFYETVEADVEELLAMRSRMNDALESEGIRLSLADFIAKAIAVALVRHPQVNAHLSGNEITRYGDVHLGMAVALPEGLIVPVLRNINQMGLKEIRQRSADLIDRARNQKLKGDEMTGATFTVSNLGTYGVKEFSAIINPPEVGILAVAAAEKRPVVRGDSIVPRTMMNLTLSADHRAVDGATAAEFLRTLKQLLEEPGMMLV